MNGERIGGVVRKDRRKGEIGSVDRGRRENKRKYCKIE